ncbi:hypothetical protein BCR36DRAFT_582810 [Piromyces finnis]|uniref:MSP domain-containing protein n=1 Tax=Piromyces finnis TaxID=1754191 RepID=A0A1Y1VCD6_9FUNG|nr:hypothetical protein BCR36DRAFT_582810 [Piromyces finnis]|eukprot:ORX51768.1 hypothetical protein BCR36DRAFT_582810 [Piromyces finnis]
MATAENSEQSLIELVDVNTKFILENVYLNDLHALKRINIKNIAPYPILVKLRSNLGNQISFQLNNDNLENENEFLNSVLNDQSNSTPEPYGSNISLFSPINSYSDNESIGHNYELKIKESTYSTSLLNNMNHTTANAVYNKQFNQLFNYVGQIDEVQIEPGQTVPVIVEFLPENKEKINMQNMDILKNDGSDAFLNTYNDEDANYNFFEINGLLFFIAYRLDTILQKQHIDLPITIADKNKDSNIEEISINSGNITENENNNTTDGDINNNESLLEEINNVTSNIPSDQQITLKFRSKVCKSVLWIDIGETGISFDDCVLGGTYFKDFTLWNRSEIDLYWIMNITDTLGNSHVNWLTFYNYDTGEELDCKPLSAFAHLRIRVKFRPQEIGEFSYDFQIENANDMNNVEETKITSVVRAVKREESLVVSSGNILDFGDCCAGVWTKQQIILRNVSDVPLDINFQGVDADVKFKIKIDDMNSENKENFSVKPYPPPSREDSFLSSRSTLSELNKFSNLSNDIPNSPMSSTIVSPTITTNYMDNSSTNSINVTGLGLYTNQSMNEYSLQPSEINSRVSSPVIDGNNNSNNTSLIRSEKRSQSNVLDYVKWTEKINEERRTTLSSIYDKDLYNENDEGEKSNDYMQTEDIILKPRNEKTVLVYYRPEQKELTANYSAGRLTKETFKIIIHYSSSKMQQKEKKKITCRARSCTSFIEVLPKVVNFGDTNVGTLRSLPIKIYNRSDLSAKVEPRFISKVLNCIRGPYEIPPRQSLEVKIDIYPRKVNPDYRKQITVVNHLNKSNNQNIEIQSTNIDKHGVTFHSLFYRIITSNSTNFIDLGDVILNSPAIRTFSISNISKKPLTLQLTASLSEIGIYTENKEIMKMTQHKTEAVITTERRKKILENMADKRRGIHKLQSKSIRITPNDRQHNELFYKGKYSEDSPLFSRNDYLDLATLPNTLSPSSSNPNNLSAMNNSINGNSLSLIHTTDLINGGTDDNKSGNDDTNPHSKSNKKIIKSSSKNHKHHNRQCSSTSSTSSARSLSITSLESYERDVMRKNRHSSKSKSRSRSGSRNKSKSNMDSLSFKNLTELKVSKSDYLPVGQSKRSKKVKKNRNKLKDYDDFFVVGSKKSNKILEKIHSLKDTTDSGSEIERINEKLNNHHYNRHNRTISSLNLNSKIDDSKDPHSTYDNEFSGNEQNYGNHNNSSKHSNINDSNEYISDDIRTRFNNLINQYESNNYNLTPVLPKLSMEAEFVQSRIVLRNELDYILNSNYLNPVQTIEIPSQSEKRIILIYIPSSQNKPFIQRKPRKQDAKIFIKLENFDREIPRPQFETLLKADTKNIPVRELMIRFSLCRSVMDLGQKNINFGMLSKGDSKTKTIIIHNRSEASLLYNIKKSGSIASSDLVFNKGRMGIVSGYSTREVSFVFEPSLHGQFHEKLIVENINDRENNQILSVKANIKKTSNFSLETSKLDFGNCVINELCFNIQNVIIKSTCNKQRRYLEICYIEPEDVKSQNYKLEFEFEDEDELYETDRLDKRNKPVILTKEMEEELEHLEQKLKIAKRKGRKDKVKKMQIKIERLKSGKKEENKYDEKVENEEQKKEPEVKTEEGESENDGKGTAKKATNSVQVKGSIASSTSTSAISKYKRTKTSFIFPIEPQEIKNITIKIFPKLKSEFHERLDLIPKGTIEEITGNFMIIEHRNNDTLKKLPFTANLYFDKSLYLTEVLKKDLKEINDSSLQRQLNINQSSQNISKDSIDSMENNKTSVISESSMIKNQSIDIHPSEDNKLPPMPYLSGAKETTECLVAEPEPIIEVVNTLAVEVTSIDLGKIEINDEKDCYFTLTNNSDQPIKYIISKGNSKLFLTEEIKDKKITSSDSPTDSIFELDAFTGEINGHETKRIDLTLIPFKHGRNEATIFVKEDSDKSENKKVTFKFYGRNESYLAFPDLDKNALFDMKNCFVDYTNKYSKVTPFHVKNIYEKDLYLNCTSNLSQQCLIFTNESLEQPAQNILIKKGETIVVYIALQPNLGINRLINKTDEDNTIMEDSLSLCRTLIGGLRFSINIKEKENDDELFQLLIQTVKFTTFIGQSLLMLSESLINFGFCKKIGQEFNSSFYITNLVPSLPLEYEIECSSDNIIVEERKGIIEPSNTTESEESKLTTKDKKKVKFRFCPKSYGFINEYIVVKNVNNALQVSKINIRLFVNKNYLKINRISPKKEIFTTVPEGDTTSNKKSKSLPQLMPTLVDKENSKEVQNCQTILWNNVYVNIMKNEEGALYPYLQKNDPSEEAGIYEQSILVENTSFDEMVLVPRSDLDLQIKWYNPLLNTYYYKNDHDEASKNEDQQKDDGWNNCGPEIKLIPGQKVHLYISAPNPTRLSSNEEINALTSGKSIDLSGSLLLFDKKLKMDVMAFNLNAYYNMSMGHINETEIDIGKIGHTNLWRDVPLSFELKNDSVAPLCVKLILPEFVELINRKETIGNNLIISSFSSAVIEAKVKPHNIPDFKAEFRTYYIKVVNKFNSENTMNVKLLMELTEFELRYERLNKGELFLPPLYHPYNAEVLPCDNWFTILNTSDHDVKFELGFKLAHEIASLVNIEVLSRFSNSPVIGTLTLAAHNSIEIKVRAYSREDSKLDNEKCKNIVNVDGITFGKLWIITHQTLKEFPYQSSGISALSNTNLSSVEEQESKNVPLENTTDEKSKLISRTNEISENELYLSTNRYLIDQLKKIIDKNKDILNDPNNRQILDGVPLKGKIIEGPTFSISNNRIEFRSYVYSDSELSDNENDAEEDVVSTIQNKKKQAMNIKKMDMRIQTETFVITNLSKVFPLNFKVDIEYPIELMSRKDVLKLSPLDENMCGIVEPNGRLPITIEMLKSNIQGVSEDVKIHIYDVNSLSKTPINVYIGIIEESSNVIVPEEVNDLIDIDEEEEEEYIEISQQSPEEGNGFKHKKITSISEEMNERKLSIHGDIPTTESISVLLSSSNSNNNNNNNILSNSNNSNNNNHEELEEIEENIDNKSTVTTNIYGNEEDLVSNTNIDEEDDTWLSDIISVSSMQSIGDRSIISNTIPHSYGNINGMNKEINESVRKYNSHMMVRGCQKVTDAITGKEVKRFYLLNFGQQDLGSSRISKKITLENISFEQVSYKISTVCDHLDKSWIILSRYEGVLDFPRTSSGGPASGLNGNSSIRRESHSITININSAVRGVYSTYIIIRNLYNPLDFKIIKVYVEIVAKHNLQRVINPSSATSSLQMFQNNQPLTLETTNLALVQSNRVFDVYLNGMDAESTSFQLDNLFYGRESTARSLVIFNRENVPLEFTIKSNLSQNNSFEVIFSLSRTSVKLYSVLTIQPLSSVRVYIRFRPDLPEDAPVKKSLTLEESNLAVKEEAEIYINCRLVKDYQLTIPLKATIRMPQIDIPIKEFTFKGKIFKKEANSSPINSGKSNANASYGFIDGMVATTAPALQQNKNEEETWNVNMKPVTSNIITVHNLFVDDLEFIVMNDSIYFDVEIVSINDSTSNTSMNTSMSSLFSKESLTFSVNRDKDKELQAEEDSQDLIHDLTRVVDSSSNAKTNGNKTSTNNQTIVYVIPGGGVCNLKIIPRIDSIMRDINSIRRDKYLQEHLTIYNKKRPTEKVWIVLKMSFGNIIDFQSSSVQKSAYNVLECRIIRLLREIDRYIEVSKSSTLKDHSNSNNAMVNTSNLYFKYHYLVDQLIYYGTREHSGDESFRLAILLFSSLFFYPTFGESLIVNNSKWINSLTHFLNFFPYNNQYIDILRNLCFSVKNTNTTSTMINSSSTPVGVNLTNDNLSKNDHGGNENDSNPDNNNGNNGGNNNSNNNNNNNNYNEAATLGSIVLN